MKKLLLLSVLFLGIFPVFNKGKLVVCHIASVYADDFGDEESDDPGDFGDQGEDNGGNTTIDESNLYSSLSSVLGLDIIDSYVDENGNTVLQLDNGNTMNFDSLSPSDLEAAASAIISDGDDILYVVDDNLNEVRITSVRQEQGVQYTTEPDGSILKTYLEVWTNPNNQIDYDYHYVAGITGGPPPTGEPATYDGNAWFGTNFVGPGPDADPFSLGLSPKDELDLAAEVHDFEYWSYGATGISGALFDEDTKYADLQLLNAASAIAEDYYYGVNDRVTGLPISEETRNEALAVVAAFAPIVASKFNDD